MFWYLLNCWPQHAATKWILYATARSTNSQLDQQCFQEERTARPFILLQVGHIRWLELEEMRSYKLITRAMKPLLFGEWNVIIWWLRRSNLALKSPISCTGHIWVSRRVRACTLTPIRFQLRRMKVEFWGLWRLELHEMHVKLISDTWKKW